MNLSIPQYAKRAVAEFPDVTMSWVDGVGRIDRSIAELGAAVDSVSNGLRQLGLPAGSIIVCQLPNMVENVVLFHAALLAGMVIAPVVPTRGPRDIQQIIATTGARCFVGIDLQEPAAWRDSVTRFGDVGTLSTLVGVHGAGDGAVPWEQLAQTQGPAAPVPDAQAAAVILFTSGTTGRPKAVVHTHRSLLARSLTTIPGADEGEHIEMAVLPSGHIGGAVRAVRMICRGIPTIFLNTWDARRALDLIESDRVTSMGLTPFFLTQLMDQQRANPVDSSSLRHILVGGANVPPADVLAANELGWPVVRSYGSTEYPMSFVGRTSDPVETRANSDGRADAGAQVRLVTPDGNTPPAGTPGEIYLRGPGLCAGYLNPNDTAGAFTDDGWFRTGDLGVVDSSGFLTVTGRVKDIIIRGGENISAGEVEALVCAHPAVIESAAVGYPDEKYGERVCVYVTVRADATLSVADLDEHFRALGADRRKTPERVIVLAQLPRTESGKIAKSELRARLAGGA